MNNPWFRMYAGVINDPKVMKLPEATRWRWVACLCVASDNSGRLPAVADMAFSLRMSEQQVAVLVTELHRAGLLDKVDGGFAPHNWEGRQYKSDSSTKRVREHRDRLKQEADFVAARKAHLAAENVSRNVTGNVSPDVTETDQSRAEQKQSRTEQTAPRAVQVDLVEEALRADLREVLGGHVDLSRIAEWLGKGYDPGTVRDVVRDLRRRKPDIASLAYFDAALADRHSKRAETPSDRAGYAAVTDFDKVLTMFVRTGVWSRYAGPEPGMGGCRAPAELLAKHGIDAATGDKIRRAS